MFGSDIGTLRIQTSYTHGSIGSGTTVWSMSGAQGSDWKDGSATINSGSFTFEYLYGGGWKGDAAIDSVTVDCAGGSGNIRANDLAVTESGTCLGSDSSIDIHRASFTRTPVAAVGGADLQQVALAGPDASARSSTIASACCTAIRNAITDASERHD